jgi:hypothetical protein
VSGRASRRKGHNFERKVARDLRKILGDARRGYQSRNSIDKVEDIQCPLLAPECKAYKANAPIRRAYEQALEVCPDNKIPMAITKEDYKEPLVTLSYKDFLAMLGVMVDAHKAHMMTGKWNNALEHMIEQKKAEQEEDDGAGVPESPQGND